MGGQGSKTSAAQPPQDANKKSLNEGTQAQHFEFGYESEFWFMLEVRRSSAHSAKQLHQWMTGLLKDTTSQILGVKYLKDGEFIGTQALRPQHVLVYGKDFKTIQQTWNRLSNSDLDGISKVICMEEPSKSTPREVSASAEQVRDRDRKFGDSHYTSIGVTVSDHKKTPLNNLEKNQTSLKFSDAPLDPGVSQRSKIYSSRGDACKATFQDQKRYQGHQNKRTSYGNEGTVTTEPKLLSQNTRRINNATVGKEDEPKLWSNTGRFKNATVGRGDEPKLSSNTRRYDNATLVKEEEPKPWSSIGRFKNATVGKEDETKLCSNTGGFKNATVGKEDETKLCSNTGRFKNATVGKEDETKLCSNTGRFKNATVGKEDETKPWSNTGGFRNASLGKEDRLKVHSDTGSQFDNAAVLKEDEPKQQAQQLTCDFDFTPRSKKESSKTLPQNQKEANNDVANSKKNYYHSSLTKSGPGVTSERQNVYRESNTEHLNIEKSSEAAFPLFNTADQPSSRDTFVKKVGSLNENEATSLAHVKGDTTLFVSDLPTDSCNDKLIQNKENVKKRKNHEENSIHIFSDEFEQNANISSKQDVQPRTLSLTFTPGNSLDNLDKCPRDDVAVGIHDEPFSPHLSLDGQNEANAKISEINAVQEGSYNNGVVNENATQENALEEISINDETESVGDSISESSKISYFSEGNNKDPFLVILRNLPVSLKRQEIIALFNGIHPGFVKVPSTRKKGKAIAVFSSKEHASNCAKQMKGKIIRGSKIVAFAKISKSNSNFDKGLLKKDVPGANEKVSCLLESKHMESEEFCTEDVEDQQQEQKQQQKQQQMQHQQKPQLQKHKQLQQNQQTQKQLQNQQRQEEQPQKRQQQRRTLKQQHHEPEQQQKQQLQKHLQQKRQRQKQKQQQHQQTQKQQQSQQPQEAQPQKQLQNQQTQKQQRNQRPQEAQQQETQPLTRKRKQLTHEKQQLLKKHEPLQQKQQEQKPQHQQQKTLQQQEQQSQEQLQLQMQQKQRHPQEQLSSQQQQWENDIGKEKIVLLLQQQLALKQQQQQISKVPQNHAVQLLGFPQVKETPEIQNFIHDLCQGVEIINVVKDVEDLEKYFVKLKSRNDCQEVKEALQGSSFRGKKIKSIWIERYNTNLDKPCVVVENLLPQMKCQDVRKLFANCKGVVNVGIENAKKSHARVYFESVDLAGEAVKQMNGFRVGQKELRVTPGVGISEELEWRKLECQVQEYLELSQRRREVLLRKNDEKLNDLEINIPDPQPRRKKISLEEFARREKTKKTYEGKKHELIEQRNEFEKKFQQLFENFNQQVEEQRSVNNKKGIKFILQNHKSKTDREFRKFDASLPIYAKRTEILETIHHSQVVVLIGETGSGKSTQVAQYLAEETLSHGGKIVVTQPRKIAAISLAKRVSDEFGCEVGQEVGYHVGLDKKINNKTIIKFVTDRILLNEVLKGDEIMQQYSCIVIDEAHERSIHTDLLVAMLKQKLASFPHLKLIVTSATLNTEIFRTYFDNCPLVKVPGRTFPVERVYSRERPKDYVEGVYDKVVEVCQSGEQGDILVFLTQQNEIEKTCDWLEKKLGKAAVILPLHGKLQSEEQQKVFEATPKGKRKIVIATNSAETSLTIDGIRVVIDSGMVKEPSFDPERNMTTLDVKLVSKSSAEQRAGRAGRTGPGKCYCMYTKDDYSNMQPSTKPEILKMHLGMAVLQLLSLGVTDIEHFDFVESPSRDALKKALETLKLLDALNHDGTLNGLGEEMLKLPTEPQLSKALLEGLDRGCGDNVIIAAALMSSGHDVFYRGTVEKRNECAIQKQEFCQVSGDLLSAIDVYKKWSEKSPKSQVAWCKENALNSKLLRSARETFNEIRYALNSIRPAMRNSEVTAENIQESLSKSLLAGYFENIAWSFGHEKLGYMAVSSNQKARIHPSSVLCSLGDQPEWVLYQQLKRTNDQVFLINITPIRDEWLAEVAMHMLQYIDEEAIARLRVVRHSIYPVGPELVKAVIGYQGSTIKHIETSVSHYSVGSPDIFCAVECNVDKGMVDVYTTADSLGFATQQVEDVIQRKRCELQSFSEVFVSNVGGLKTLVASDLTTRLILQPGTSCKFNVFVEKEDVSEEVESDDVLAVLSDAGNVIHHAIFTNPRDERNFRWGNVTYSDVDQAEEANSFLRFDLDQDDLPYNVHKIQLRPIPTESVASQIYTQPSGVTVLVSWFPLPASGKAYIKCNSPDIAVEIVRNLNQQMALTAVNRYKTAFLQKSGGDVALHVQETDDEFTVKKQLEDYCTELQNESILKIVVPSEPSPDEVDRDAEKAKLVEVMKEFGSVNVLRPWIANRKKVCARVLFEDLVSAEDAIQKLHEQMDVMGARAMYLELESRREVTCDGRMYDKIKKEIDSLKNDEINIEVEPRGKRKKIIITGEDPVDVQTIGAKIADLVRPEVVMIEEAAVAKLLGSGYGRGKVKQIQKKNDVIIQTSNFGRRIQIMGKSNAKRQTQTQIEKLIEDLQKTTRVEIDLRNSERPIGAIREILKQFGKDLNKLVEGEDCQAWMQIKRRKLEVHGEKEAVYNVQNKVEKFLKTLPNTPRNTNFDSECPVCFADVEDPYLLTLCGHAYCSDCITQYVNNIFDSVKSADMFPQKCLFDKCESPIIKEDYSKLLKTEQLQKLYLASLECFLIGNPKYKPCSTPDCSWVYEATPGPSVFSCPECDIRLCKKCGDSAHEMFETCEAFKASKDPLQSDRLYNEWVAGANTKKCPRCSVMIEKNEGCPHMHCTQCGAHICWKCGEYFEAQKKCYDHIPLCNC